MPVVLVLLASVLWGTTGTVASLLPHDVAPIAVGSVTFCLGGLLLFAAFPRASWRLLADRRMWPWIAVGIVGTVVYPLAFYESMALAGVALGTVVTLGSAPVFAALVEFAFERTPLTWRWMLGTAFGVAGVVLLAVGAERGPSERTGGSIPLAIGLALAAGLAYAVYTYATRRIMHLGGAPLGAMGAVAGASAVLLIPVLVLFGAPLLQSGATIAAAGYLAIGPMYLAYILFAYGLARVSASAATTITLAEPAVASILAVTVVGERLTAAGWLGIVLIAAGIVFAAWAHTRADGDVATLPPAPPTPAG